MGERKRVDGNEKAQGYGQRYWVVDLADGGWVSVHANRVEVSAGAVVFYGTGHERNDDGTVDYARPRNPDYPVIGFGAGEWKTFHAASVLDGHPVAVDRWVENSDSAG